MEVAKFDLFEDITPKSQAYIEVLAKAALIFSVYRYENDLTQAQLAKKLGISQVMVSKIESGDSNISLKNLSDYLFDLGMKLEISTSKVSNRVDFTNQTEMIITLKQPKLYPYPNGNSITDFELVA